MEDVRAMKFERLEVIISDHLVFWADQMRSAGFVRQSIHHRDEPRRSRPAPGPSSGRRVDYRETQTTPKDRDACKSWYVARNDNTGVLNALKTVRKRFRFTPQQVSRLISKRSRWFRSLNRNSLDSTSVSF